MEIAWISQVTIREIVCVCVRAQRGYVTRIYTSGKTIQESWSINRMLGRVLHFAEPIYLATFWPHRSGGVLVEKEDKAEAFPIF